MKKRSCLALIVFLSCVSAGGLLHLSPAQADTTYLVFTTGGIGGTWYPIGSGVAAYITKNVDGINIASQSSGGGTENLNLINSGQADLGFLPSSAAYQSYRGIGPYDKAYKNMMGLGMFHRNAEYVYALKKSGMKTISDLKGKKVNAGPAGTGMNKVLSDILAAHDMSMSDITPVYLPYQDAGDALKDGRIDATIETAGLPAPTVLDVASVHDIVILEFSPGSLDKMIEMNPYYIRMTLPGGTYPKIDQDIPIISEGTIWVCRPGLSEDVVYKIVEATYSKPCLEHLGKVHAAAKWITVEDGLNGMTIKLHPGAVKFWKQIGLYEAWQKKKLYE